jgi:hypothetical protein
MPDRALDHLFHVVASVDVDQAECAEVDGLLAIVVEQLPHPTVVVVGHVDAAQLEALHELMEFHGAVEVHVELAKRLPVILELLLEAHVDDPQQLLYMVHLLLSHGFFTRDIFHLSLLLLLNT